MVIYVIQDETGSHLIRLQNQCMSPLKQHWKCFVLSIHMNIASFTIFHFFYSVCIKVGVVCFYKDPSV